MTPLLELRNGTCRYGATTAVDKVSLALHRGESLGVVGESGSGKTTVLRMLLGLAPLASGDVLFNGTTDLSQRHRSVQVVFQNPHAALDPRFTVLDAIAEPLLLLRTPKRGLKDRIVPLLEDVGLTADFLTRYPHELSGGQKQRICIARALAPGPTALLLDEPTSALDVSVQAQIIDLLANLRKRHGLAYLFVSHNLAVVRLLCDRVAVMRAGTIIEEGPAASVLATPSHAYTRALLAAVLPPRVTSARQKPETP